jgi:hypothetical protein
MTRPILRTLHARVVQSREARHDSLETWLAVASDDDAGCDAAWTEYENAKTRYVSALEVLAGAVGATLEKQDGDDLAPLLEASLLALRGARS